MNERISEKKIVAVRRSPRLAGRVMRVGFTGTREGLTSAQRDALREVLRALAPSVLAHGDCVGSDAAAHAVARDLDGVDQWKVARAAGAKALTIGAASPWSAMSAPITVSSASRASGVA